MDPINLRPRKSVLNRCSDAAADILEALMHEQSTQKGADEDGEQHIAVKEDKQDDGDQHG